MDTDISYDERRRKNIADNKRILAEIGLANPFKDKARLSFKKTGIKRKSEPARKPKRPLLEQNVDPATQGSIIGTRRKSARLQGQTTPKREELDYDDIDDEWEEEDYGKKKKKFKIPAIKYSHVKVEKNRPNFYGAVEGVEVGVVWMTRMECCRDGIHRPTVAGIHAGSEGAYSIALSGGYDDNVDWGECFTYTGEGGRDLKGTPNKPKNLRTAPQSKDQTLTRGNLALSKNVETGNPVRVIRGYKLNSPFAPEEGYRYDGLYSVEKAWFTTGLSGFGVWKFALRRLDDQAPPPWEFTESYNMDEANNNGVRRLSSEGTENQRNKSSKGKDRTEEKENDSVTEKTRGNKEEEDDNKGDTDDNETDKKSEGDDEMPSKKGVEHDNKTAEEPEDDELASEMGNQVTEED